MTRLRRPTDGAPVPPHRPSVFRPRGQPAGRGRRNQPIRRRSAGLTPLRAGAALALLLAAAGVYGAASSEVFTAQHVEVTGATWTTDAAVRKTLDVPRDQNLFLLATGPLRVRLESLSPVLRADVAVSLPDTLRVSLVEREALLIWSAGTRAYLVDGAGVLFLALPEQRPAAARALPVVVDSRSTATALDVGSRLDPIDLDAALRLGSLRAHDLGSAAERLSLRVDDAEGFTVRTGSGGWTAVFGFYTPTLRTTELIPGQVRLLRSLLAGREAEVQKLVLADDRNGTYIPRPTPAASPSAAPSMTP